MSEKRYTKVTYNDRAYNACMMEPHPKGEWVKYSDYQALEAERDELRELIRSICPPAWDDERMDYVEVQIDKDDYARMQALGGGDDN